jgi:hypothetical protein
MIVTILLGAMFLITLLVVTWGGVIVVMIVAVFGSLLVMTIVMMILRVHRDRASGGQGERDDAQGKRLPKVSTHALSSSLGGKTIESECYHHELRRAPFVALSRRHSRNS